MKLANIKIVFCVALILFFISCKKDQAVVDEKQTPIISINDRVLYKSELMKALPSGVSGQDSIAAAEAYIKKWAVEELVYDKAKKNIIDEKLIDELVRDYRKSLIVHSYQERILKEHLSSKVSDSELMRFYNENKDLFQLKENIIKGLYLKVPLQSPELNNFKKWYTLSSANALENIEKKHLQNAVGYEYFYDKWVSLESVMENIPYLVSDAGQFLKSRKTLEVQDSSFVYLLNIKEYKLAGEEAPFEYEKTKLTDLFLKRKEGDYLKQIKEDLYQKALSDKDIVFYNKID